LSLPFDIIQETRTHLVKTLTPIPHPPPSPSPIKAPPDLPRNPKSNRNPNPTPPWKPATAQSDHSFERSSLTNGTPGAQEYDLAPDDEKTTAGKTIQTWNLKDYRTMNLFLRCRYHDTSATLFIDIPATYTNSTLTFTLDKKGNFLGKSNLLCR
jgi:hypothetical protein